MTTPRDLGDKSEGFILGRWLESLATLLDENPSIAGADRNRVIEYDRKTAGHLGRSFNNKVKGARSQSDIERARAARHVYRSDTAGGYGLDERHLEILSKAGANLSTRGFATDRLVQQMDKLFEAGRKNGIGVTIRENDGVVTVVLKRPPEPKPVLKPAPPKGTFRRGF